MMWSSVALLSLFTNLSLGMPLFIEKMVSSATTSFEALTSRSANTCADASLAKPVYLSFAGVPVAHVLGFRWLLANEDSKAGSAYWTLQGEVFRAWQTQQPFTVPLFNLVTPDGSDYVSLLGTDAATPPVLSGFNSGGIEAWVYNNPVCGSVPLYSLANAKFSDHYFTVDTEDRDNLVQQGWTDGGIIAYVLPL